MNRDDAFRLMCEFTENEALRRHMLCVEIAMRAYAKRLDGDQEKWGMVGLLHDFDYERWPNLPDHPLQGSRVLAERGYPDDVIYAIKSHVGLPEYPRKSLMDRVLFACDELSGFVVACALVRPDRIRGMKAKSVRKKMKQKSFAAQVNRDDIIQGADEIGIDLNEHIQFVIDAIQPHSELLNLDPETGVEPE